VTLKAPTVDDGPIWSAWMAAFHAPTLAIADEIGLFAAIASVPMGSEELATTLAIEPRATEAIAGVMAALGFLALVDDKFELTETARTYLLPSSPFYWGGMLRRIRDNPLDCRKLIDSLRRGKAAAEARLTSMWQAPQPPPEALVAFTHAMHAHSFSLAMRTIAKLALRGRLLDVAGGSGSYSIAAALHDPDLRCTLLDLPPVCGVAASYAADYGVGDRVSSVPADMFGEDWPGDHDAILLADILHDWDDQRCSVLAHRAFAALRSRGRVIVHEMLLSDNKIGPANAISYSMIMVFVTQGRQRSAPEVRAILESAGFADIRIIPTANGYSAIEGTRP
jgi:O-methyltransferase domain